MSWLTYGLFVTSLPQLFEFLPAKSAQAAQNWMTANIGARLTSSLALLGLFLATFLAWKSKDDELARRRIYPTLINMLANQMTQSGNLFAAGQRATSAADINAWNIEFSAWFAKTRELIETNISQAEAALSREVPGGGFIGPYRSDEQPDRSLNTLLGYQEALRRIIERYSDR